MIFVPAPGRTDGFGPGGRNGFALTAISLLPLVDPINPPEKPQISSPCALGPQSDEIFFRRFVGEGHPHSS
jgi:hypothetical protein